MPFFRKVLFFWPETALRRQTPRATARIAAQAAQNNPVWHGARRLFEPMAQADFFAPFSGATASWRFCSRAVSALRLPGTLAAVTHRKSNRPFSPAKQNAAKPPARRIFRRTFRPPGKIRLKPTKPDACRQAGAALVPARRRSPAGTGPQYGQVLYAASSVRKRASAFGHILRLFGPAEDGTHAAPNAAAKNAGLVFAPFVCARGVQRNRAENSRPERAASEDDTRKRRN